jgi:type IV pilus assembly protein PilB
MKLQSCVRLRLSRKKSLQDIVVQRGVLSDEALSKGYAKIVDIPFVKLDPKKIDVELLKLVPERISRRYNSIVFGKQGDVMQLAMEDPDDLQAVDFIQKQLGSKPAIYMTTKQNICHCA